MSDALTVNELDWLIEVATKRPHNLDACSPEVRRALVELRDLRELVRRHLDALDARPEVPDAP